MIKSNNRFKHLGSVINYLYSNVDLSRFDIVISERREIRLEKIITIRDKEIFKKIVWELNFTDGLNTFIELPFEVLALRYCEDLFDNEIK